jgi:hypothetical protein
LNIKYKGNGVYLPFNGKYRKVGEIHLNDKFFFAFVIKEKTGMQLMVGESDTYSGIKIIIPMVVEIYFSHSDIGLDTEPVVPSSQAIEEAKALLLEILN